MRLPRAGEVWGNNSPVFAILKSKAPRKLVLATICIGPGVKDYTEVFAEARLQAPRKHSNHMKLVTLLALLCTSLLGQAVTLEWNPNSESTLAGYKLYVGRASRQYYTNFVTTNTSITLSNLVNGTNFFAVTAFDTAGLENDYSDEVSTIVTNRLEKVQGLRFRSQMGVQSAPTVTGPWSPAVEIAQLDTTPGSQFYRLQLATILQNNVTPPSAMPLSAGSRVGKLLPATKTARVIRPPPTPPQ